MIWYCLITHFFGRVSALGLEPTLDGCSRTLAQLYGPWDLQDHFPLDQKNRCQNHQSPTPWKKTLMDFDFRRIQRSIRCRSSFGILWWIRSRWRVSISRQPAWAFLSWWRSSRWPARTRRRWRKVECLGRVGPVGQGGKEFDDYSGNDRNWRGIKYILNTLDSSYSDLKICYLDT